jgi:uncharacterized protein
MASTSIHHTHPEIVKRLKRAEGHLRVVIGMIEEGRACVELAQQLHAIEKALASAKKTLIHDHIDQCLEHSVGRGAKHGRAPLDEFKQISKYL